ncbi:MAG: IS200/IS605 family transposase [Saprospiraceae bacterium]
MPNTYTQLYVHVVFAVRGRANLISNLFKERLYQYITGIISSKNQKLMIINGMPDHIHILMGPKPDCNLSALIRDIKANSSKWVNENRFTNQKFEWQTGFSAFSVSQSRIDGIVNYILRQEQHHQDKSFTQECVENLNEYKVAFDPNFLMKDFGDILAAENELVA